MPVIFYFFKADVVSNGGVLLRNQWLDGGVRFIKQFKNVKSVIST